MNQSIDNVARHYCIQARARRDRMRRLALPVDRSAPIDSAEDGRAAFARAVMDRMDGPVLRYAMRRELLRIGRAAGLAEFDSQLIIAQVQHQRSMSERPTTDSSAGGWRGDRLIPLAAGAALQMAIFAAGWAIVS